MNDTINPGDRVSWTETRTVRQFGTNLASPACPCIGCGVTHYHVRDDNGIVHVINPRRITREETV